MIKLFISTVHFLLQPATDAGQLSVSAPEFEAQVIDDSVSIGYGLAIGDGNGKPDILLADKDQIVWYRNGDWHRFVICWMIP